MYIDPIVLYLVALIGIVMIFATRYVVKGRGRDMTRLWFITVFAFIVYYWLTSGSNYFYDPKGLEVVYTYAFLWPIAAILAFWIAEKLTEKGTGIPFFKWVIYFLVAVVFAVILDGAAGALGWYTYNSDKLAAAIVNPLGGASIPALMPFLMGLLMMGVFFLAFTVHKRLRDRRISETSATLLLGGLAVVLSAALWVISNLLLEAARSLF